MDEPVKMEGENGALWSRELLERATMTQEEQIVWLQSAVVSLAARVQALEQAAEIAEDDAWFAALEAQEYADDE